MKPIPPLSQSREAKLACPEFYALTEIDGVQPAPSVFSDRGTEVHKVIQCYAEQCFLHQVPSDWGVFDILASSLGPDAGEIVDRMRDNLIIDWEHFHKAELYLWLTGEFDPRADLKPYAYEGTLDAVYLNGTSGKIEDYKSHWRPFDADTFQSKLYPFLLMQHYSQVEEVEFVYIFVRFKNARRSVTYTRADLPKLAAEIERARKRQLAIHEKRSMVITRGAWPTKPSELPMGTGRSYMEAIPGSHCVYCPHLAKGTCPLGSRNPYAEMTLEDRLRQVVYFDQARKHQLTIIKEYVDQAQKPVEFTTGTGDKYTAAFGATESGYYPLVESVAMLAEWVGDNPDDNKLWDNLRVGSTQLKSKLKAKKRADLDQRMRDTVMVKETAVKFAIRRNGEEEEAE